jgi:uncharacterized protein (TIGR03435 family)
VRIVLVVLIAVFATGIGSGQSAPVEPKFDVASVKLHVSGSGVSRNNPGRLVLRGASISGLIMRSYGLQAEQQLVAPAWAYQVTLDIDARMPEGATQEQIPRMLQALLAERLKLAVHEESRVLPVFELTVGKTGPKMKEVDPSKAIDQVLRLPLSRGFRGHMTISRVALLLSESLDRYVLDSTGLKAIYDIDLRWTPDELRPLTGATEAQTQPLPVASDLPNLFTAIQQQLGLKLETRRAPVQVIVVDHVERTPTEN